MKLLIVRSSQTSTWGSCKVISPNLQKTYEQLPSEFQINWFDIPADYIAREMDTSLNSIPALAREIEQQRPDQLVFVDHLPNPADILMRLSLVLDQKKIPPVSVHLYGDFTYFSKDWLDLSNKLARHPIRFITASTSQKRLLEYFCEDSTDIIPFCFPVNTDEYFFDEKARIQLRKEQHIADNDIILLYSGRISLQKNVDLLLMEYLELLKNEEANVHLWITGGFDDLGAPFMGLETHDGYLSNKLQSIINQHPKHFTKNIKILGNLDKLELRKIQSAADLFVSFSLYHDEDFGMSPAEALACGLPSLLTDWGGYSSFASTKWKCKLAPVKISEYGLEIKTSSLKEFFQVHKQTYVSSSDRERWSAEFSKDFSIKNNVDRLKNIIKSPVKTFAGFNWKLSPFANIYSKQHRSKVIDPNTCPSSKNFYAEVYRNYISLEQNTNDHTKIVNWTYDYILHSQMDPALPVGRKIRPNHYYLKPFSLEYVGPHNPVLLGGYITKKLLNKKLWTLRDGLIPLAFFFREHSPEQGVNYAIPAEFWFAVPEHWRKNVLLCENQAETTYSWNNPPSKILLTGMQDSVFADEQELAEALTKLQKDLGAENLRKANITALFPHKQNNLWGKRSDDETFSLAQKILDCTGLKITFTEWSELKDESDFKNSLYIELNEKYFIADSFVQHFALSRGAGLLNRSSELPLKEVSVFRLSPHHSITLSTVDWTKLPAYKDPFESPYLNYFQELIKGQVKSIRISPKWESWYPLYLKKYYKLHKT